MELHFTTNPALTVGIALAAGVIAQASARYILMPSIVVLLVTGVLLGPDVAGLVVPEQLGAGLPMLVGFAVAVILFEGGMNLDIRRLRAEALVIRRLVTIGAIITALGATIAARYLMGWDWRLSALFGTLVIVTGPTVVTPLMRRLRVTDPVNTVLRAEGVLIDPIGAIIAVVTLEVLYAAEGTTMVGALPEAAIKLGFGSAIGLLGGAIMSLMFRRRGLIPTGLENIMVLSLVVALFQISESFQRESGLAAVTVAGIVVGNLRVAGMRELIDFKEQLTVLMIGLLFVLLAADVRLADVRALGWPAVATVAALMLVVRPVQAYLCTLGTSLDSRSRLFIAAMAPRGIVAAAIASLFAQQLTARGLAVGEELRGLVFLVIAATVTIHGLTGGILAKALGLRRASDNGYAILGANGLARGLGRVLREHEHEVVFIDSNVDRTLAAEREGFAVVYGQGLQSAVLVQADVESRVGCIGLTPNEEINLLFVQKVREESRSPKLYVALRRYHGSVQEENVHAAHATILFGRARRLDRWAQAFENGTARVEVWRRPASAPEPAAEGRQPAPEEEVDMLIMTVRRRGRMRPYDDETQLSGKEEIAVATLDESRSDAESWLTQHGFTRVSERTERLADQRV